MSSGAAAGRPAPPAGARAAARALARAGDVFGVDPAAHRAAIGYLDLVDGDAGATGLAQWLMGTRVVPAVYERWWRPALGRVAKGVAGPSMAEELRIACRLLDLTEGATVLDVACGPGNFTRAFADDVGPEGTVIGLDVSATMLARAVADTPLEHAVYVRADITARPPRPGSVDAVCCFAALHLFADPAAALDVMCAALRPGGRLAILTSVRAPNPVASAAAGSVARLTGMRVFGRHEVTTAVARRGLEVVEHRRFGAVQVVGARRPSGRHTVG